MTLVDVLVVGSGPAGMATAIEARRHGLEVVVVDDQLTPGGQIWRSVERTEKQDGILGDAYVEGRAIAAEFRGCGAVYEPGAQLWQIEPGNRAFISRNGRTEVVTASAVVLATGAQERPIPFEGWTLPGVMTVGAAQILLKSSGQIPAGPLWIAGCGPLPLLYAVQFLRAGGTLAGYLDTTPTGQWKAALRHLPGALRALGDLAKGLKWQSAVRKGSSAFVSGAHGIAAIGHDRLEAVRYLTRKGDTATAETQTLLVHEGVVANIHPALSLDCDLRWDDAQDCFAPQVDEWGETSRDNVFVAGDGAGIGGAKAALWRGRIAGMGVALKLGKIDRTIADRDARPMRSQLERELAARPFLDTMFRPRREIFTPADATMICRCEEVTAGDIRAAAVIGRPGPNQIKAASRAGMGPCQGRQCGYTVTRLIAEAQGRSPDEVGYLHIRPPLKPITLGELAAVTEVATVAPTPPPSIEED